MPPRNRLPEAGHITPTAAAAALEQLLTGRAGWKHTDTGWSHRKTGLTVTPTRGGFTAFRVTRSGSDGEVLLGTRTGLEIHLAGVGA